MSTNYTDVPALEVSPCARYHVPYQSKPCLQPFFLCLHRSQRLWPWTTTQRSTFPTELHVLHCVNTRQRDNATEPGAMPIVPAAISF